MVTDLPTGGYVDGMKMRWPLAVLLAGCLGCYDPKADLEEQRPAAEKYFAAMERVGKAVKALPPLTQDTMKHPDSSVLKFDGDTEGGQNAAIIHLEELSDVGGSHVYDRIISEEYFLPAFTLLKTGKDPHIEKVTKELITWRYHQLFDKKYLVVLRTTKHVWAEVKSATEFTPGEMRGEAYLYELSDTTPCFGGYTFGVVSSSEVTARVHGGNDTERQNIDRALAVRKDMDERVAQQIHDKLRAALPKARVPSYW